MAMIDGALARRLGDAVVRKADDRAAQQAGRGLADVLGKDTVAIRAVAEADQRPFVKAAIGGYADAQGEKPVISNLVLHAETPGRKPVDGAWLGVYDVTQNPLPTTGGIASKIPGIRDLEAMRRDGAMAQHDAIGNYVYLGHDNGLYLGANEGKYGLQRIGEWQLPAGNAVPSYGAPIQYRFDEGISLEAHNMPPLADENVYDYPRIVLQKSIPMTPAEQLPPLVHTDFAKS